MNSLFVLWTKVYHQFKRSKIKLNKKRTIETILHLLILFTYRMIKNCFLHVFKYRFLFFFYTQVLFFSFNSTLLFNFFICFFYYTQDIKVEIMEYFSDKRCWTMVQIKRKGQKREENPVCYAMLFVNDKSIIINKKW